MDIYLLGDSIAVKLHFMTMTGIIVLMFHGKKCQQVLMERLQNGKRPSCSGRRQLVRIVASEILEVSKCPAKKHESEIAQQMVITYP